MTTSYNNLLNYESKKFNVFKWNAVVIAMTKYDLESFESPAAILLRIYFMALCQVITNSKNTNDVKMFDTEDRRFCSDCEAGQDGQGW